MNAKNRGYDPAMNQTSEVHQPNSSTIEEIDDKSSDGTANGVNHDEIKDDANKTSSSSSSYTRTSLPKQILKDGHFIIEDGSISSKQILWNPEIESNTCHNTVFPLNLRRVLLRYLRNRGTTENNIVAESNNGSNQDLRNSPDEDRRYQTSNNERDIEAQYPDSSQQQEDQCDGIYVPTENTSSRKYEYGDRIKSRLERDKIDGNTNNEYNIGASDTTDFVFKRPQDVFLVDSKKPRKIDSEYRKEYRDDDANIQCDKSSLILNIHVQNAKIHDHPYFIEEERVIVTLDKLYKKMVSLNETEKMRNFEVRLISILSDILDLDEFKAESKVPEFIDNTQFTHLYEAFVHIVSKIAELQFEMHSLYSSILKHWEKVLRIRQGQGFQSTTYTLVKEVGENNNDDDSHIDRQMKRFQVHCGQIQQSDTDNSFNWSQSLYDAIEAFHVAQTSRKTRQIISLKEGDNNAITNASTFVHERKRREQIRSDLYRGKLFVDDEFVGATARIKMQWPSMVFAFDQHFEILIHRGRRPKVCLHIDKVKMGFMDETISKVYLTLPGRSVQGSNHQALEFYSPIHEWYQFSSFNLTTNKVPSTNQVVGAVSVKTHWVRSKFSPTGHAYGTAHSVIKPDLNICSNHQKIIGFDQSRSKRSPKSHCSPMRLKPSVEAALNDASLRFTYEGTRHSFHNSRVLKEPVRHKLMKQRYYNKFLSSDFTIPLEEKYVSIEDTHRVASLNQLSQKNTELVEKACHEHMLANLENVRDFIARVEHVERISRNWNMYTQREFEDVVHDKSHIRAQAPKQDLSWIFEILNPPRVRTLFPTKVKRTNSSKNGSSIFITVISASNVQKREDPLTIDQGPFLMSPPSIKRMTTDLPFTSPVESFRLNRGEETNQQSISRSFVRIRIHGKVFYTRVDTGDSPIWEQRFEVPLSENQSNGSGTSSSVLEAMDDHIEIALFDKVDLDYGQGGGYYDDENTLTHDRRFLGATRISLDKIRGQNRVQGHHLLQTPDIVLGYKTQKNVLGSLDSDQIENVEHVDQESKLFDSQSTSRISTTVNLLITMQPDVAFAPNQSKRFYAPSNELPSVVSYAQEWRKELDNVIETASHKHLYDVLVPGSNGKTWLIHRFLQSQAPPQSCKSSHYRCSHYVSLLPIITKWPSLKSLKQSYNLSLSSQKFLDLLAGNWTEHAVLLANYFSHLFDEEKEETAKLDVYLMIGSTINESRVVFVMTRSLFDGKKKIWDPINGTSFAFDDTKCPLTNIGLIVTKGNIYANLQPFLRPCFLKFQLNDKDKWKPFYNNQFNSRRSVLNPVQDDILQYSNPNRSLAKELEVDILDKVKISIRSWRRTSCTFNSDIGNRLRHILEELEEHRMNGSCTSTDYRTSLSNLCRGKVVFGFPLHFGFMNTQEIIDDIEMTSIHQSKHPDGEFAAAVKVFPYECGVMSVWVFICHIAPDHFVL